MRVFVAGATGAIGRRLVPQLVAAGHDVTATTRSNAKSGLLRDLGAAPVLMDGLDAASVGEAVARAEPDAIIHQMTALTNARSLRRFDKEFAETNRLRTVGTDNLLAAAGATGVSRFIAQSFTGWSNDRSGRRIQDEGDPLDPNPPAAQRESLAAIKHVEQSGADVVLRYGTFYGPGASETLVDLIRRRQLPIAGDGGAIWSMIHLDDAAAATVAALTRGRGTYNIVDDEPAPVSEVIPYLARVSGAKAPRHVPVWLALLAGGEVGVSMLTQIKGSSNAKAKRELGWAPRWSWRTGFLGVEDATMDPTRE